MLRVTECSDEEMRFDLSNTTVGVANALRRTMIADVTSLAIETVEFQKNSSVLTDEYIAHRLGLVPLTSPNNENEAAFSLDVTCTDEKLSVTTGMLASHDAPRPAHDDIIIVKLRRNQSLKLTAKAARSNGKDHAKWTPVCTASYTIEEGDVYRFTVESTGAVKPVDVLLAAIDILRKKLNDIAMAPLV